MTIFTRKPYYFNILLKSMAKSTRNILPMNHEEVMDLLKKITPVITFKKKGLKNKSRILNYGYLETYRFDG